MSLNKIPAEHRARIIAEALDAAVFSIQQELGVKSGDVAAQFFSGPKEAEFNRIMSSYIDFEYRIEGSKP